MITTKALQFSSFFSGNMTWRLWGNLYYLYSLLVRTPKQFTWNVYTADHRIPSYWKKTTKPKIICFLFFPLCIVPNSSKYKIAALLLSLFLICWKQTGRRSFVWQNKNCSMIIDQNPSRVDCRRDFKRKGKKGISN